jgi:2-phospho-L-lactate guanylyltransferase
MLLDTLDAVLECDLGPVVVVSPDPKVKDLATRHGARAIHHAGSLNEAVAAASEGPTAAILPDLPAVRAGHIRAVLLAAPQGYVADWAGTGTTMLFGQTIAPHFGKDSARKHEQAGYPRITSAAPGLTADVDTRDDLERARVLGLGRRTADWLDRMARTA